MALPLQDHGTRRGWGVSFTPRPLFNPGKDPVPIVQEVGWAPGPVWTGAENLAPTGIRSPDRPARSQSLYRLSYPGPKLVAGTVFISCSMTDVFWKGIVRRLKRHFVFSYICVRRPLFVCDLQTCVQSHRSPSSFRIWLAVTLYISRNSCSLLSYASDNTGSPVLWMRVTAL